MFTLSCADGLVAGRAAGARCGSGHLAQEAILLMCLHLQALPLEQAFAFPTTPPFRAIRSEIAQLAPGLSANASISDELA